MRRQEAVLAVSRSSGLILRTAALAVQESITTLITTLNTVVVQAVVVAVATTKEIQATTALDHATVAMVAQMAVMVKPQRQETRQTKHMLDVTAVKAKVQPQKHSRLALLTQVVAVVARRISILPVLMVEQVEHMAVAWAVKAARTPQLAHIPQVLPELPIVAVAVAVATAVRPTMHHQMAAQVVAV